MPEDLTFHLKAQEESLKKALFEVVRIPSICDRSGGGFPFGEAIERALWKTLHRAGDLGFRVEHGTGGYYGFAEAIED